MNNLSDMMQKAKEMQEKINTARDELADMRFTGEAGGGTAKVEVDGRGQVHAVQLAPDAGSCSDDSDRETLQDLLVVAMNDARRLADEAKLGKMKDITGGVPMPPGFELPL